jgi:hypothetical protein
MAVRVDRAQRQVLVAGDEFGDADPVPGRGHDIVGTGSPASNPASNWTASHPSGALGRLLLEREVAQGVGVVVNDPQVVGVGVDDDVGER